VVASDIDEDGGDDALAGRAMVLWRGEDPRML
jgi:hypothetical protein